MVEAEYGPGFLRITRCSVDDVVGDDRRKTEFDVIHTIYI